MSCECRSNCQKYHLYFCSRRSNCQKYHLNFCSLPFGSWAVTASQTCRNITYISPSAGLRWYVWYFCLLDLCPMLCLVAWDLNYNKHPCFSLWLWPAPGPITEASHIMRTGHTQTEMNIKHLCIPKGIFCLSYFNSTFFEVLVLFIFFSKGFMTFSKIFKDLWY